MFADEILKQELKLRKKNIVKEFTQQIVEDGEIINQSQVKELMVGQEPPFVKVYTDCQLIFNDLSTSLSPVLIAFANHMNYANTDNPYFRHVVRTDSLVVEDVAMRCNLSVARIKQCIKDFVQAEVFIPIETKEGKRRRGIYLVNPWVLGKGDWVDIKKLRGEFEFVNRAFAVTMELKDGTRKTSIPLKYREEKNNDDINFNQKFSNVV